MALTMAEVAHLARLARIDLNEEELSRLAPQLEVILESVARVSELDTTGVPPTSHPEPLTNVARPDVLVPSLSQDEVLAMAPATEDDRFRVPRVIEEEA